MKLSMAIVLTGVLTLAGYLVAQDASDSDDSTRDERRTGFEESDLTAAGEDGEERHAEDRDRDRDDTSEDESFLERRLRDFDSEDRDDTEPGEEHEGEDRDRDDDEHEEEEELLSNLARANHIAIVTLDRPAPGELFSTIQRRFPNAFRLNMRGRTLEIQAEREVLEEILELVRQHSRVRDVFAQNLPARRENPFAGGMGRMIGGGTMGPGAGMPQMMSGMAMGMGGTNRVGVSGMSGGGGGGAPGMMGMGAAGGDPTRTRIANLEREAANQAQRIRELQHREGRNERVIQRLTREMEDVLREAFELRLDQQRRRVDAMRRQLESISEHVERRERLSDRIIQRRVEELVNGPGELDWNSNAPGTTSLNGRGMSNRFQNRIVTEMGLNEAGPASVGSGGTPNELQEEARRAEDDSSLLDQALGKSSLEKTLLDAVFKEREAALAASEAQDVADDREARDAELRHEHARKVLKLAELQFESRMRHLDLVIEQTLEQLQVADRSLKEVRTLFEVGRVQANAVRDAEVEVRELNIRLREAENELELLEKAGRVIEGEEELSGNGPVESAPALEEPAGVEEVPQPEAAGFEEAPAIEEAPEPGFQETPLPGPSEPE